MNDHKDLIKIAETVEQLSRDFREKDIDFGSEDIYGVRYQDCQVILDPDVVHPTGISGFIYRNIPSARELPYRVQLIPSMVVIGMILGVAFGHTGHYLDYSDRGILMALLVVPLVISVIVPLNQWKVHRDKSTLRGVDQGVSTIIADIMRRVQELTNNPDDVLWSDYENMTRLAESSLKDTRSLVPLAAAVVDMKRNVREREDIIRSNKELSERIVGDSLLESELSRYGLTPSDADCVVETLNTRVK